MIAESASQNAPDTRSGIPTPEAIEREVLDNVKHQPLGTGTVEDLAMPEDFLRRLADRVIRTSYEERYRIVVKDEAPARAAPKAAVYAGGLLAVAVVLWLVLARLRR